MDFAGTQTVNDAEILLGSGGTLASSAVFHQTSTYGPYTASGYSIYVEESGYYQGGTLTLGPDSVVRQVSQSVGLYGNNSYASSGIVNQGMVLADYSGGYFAVNAGTFTMTAPYWCPTATR